MQSVKYFLTQYRLCNGTLFGWHMTCFHPEGRVSDDCSSLQVRLTEKPVIPILDIWVQTGGRLALVNIWVLATGHIWCTSNSILQVLVWLLGLGPKYLM